MDQEKESPFKVTDKRSSFRATSPESDSSEVSGEESKPKEEPKDTEARQQAQQEPPADESSSMPLPEANFLTLIFSLYTHAQINLGVVPDPITQKMVKDLDQAKYNIDLLGMLKEKTQGNLTNEEEQALEQMLYDTRMTYVTVSKSS